MSAVTSRARLVFRLSVQAGQGSDRMARNAGGWGRDPAWSVRTMAAETAGCDRPVRRLRFWGVTRGALHWLCGTRVRLMTARAGLVSDRRCGGFPLMAALTRRGDSAAVRLVTANAVLVTGVCLSMRDGVARDAGPVAGARLVR